MLRMICKTARATAIADVVMRKTPALSGWIKSYRKEEGWEESTTERNVHDVMSAIQEWGQQRQGLRKRKMRRKRGECSVMGRDKQKKGVKESVCVILMPVCRPVSRRAGRKKHEWKCGEVCHSF